MQPDQYQQAWRTQATQTRVTVDADVLRKEVLRNQGDFRSKILRRDIVEVCVALVLIPYWFYAGAAHFLPWTWYLTVPVLIWLIGFFLVDRMRFPQQPSDPDEPLHICVKDSLTHVEHQVWLLRNIHWWYLLPPTISIVAFFIHVAWLKSQNWLETLSATSVSSFSLLALYSFVYYLNQRAVRVQFEPRRQELLTLFVGLQDETNSTNDSERPPSLESGDSVDSQLNLGASSPWMVGRSFFVIGLLITFATLASIAAHFAGRAAAGQPKLSPFAAVRWQDSLPEVKVGEEWYKLVSLNDLPAGKIAAFSQETYGDKWQKRFEEDLVELLSRMGHPPQDKVKLEVESLTSPVTQVLEEVPMTAANRRAIRAAAQARVVEVAP